MATIDVKDAANVTQTLERPLAPGQAAMAASRPVVIASNQSAVPISGTVTANAGTGTMTVSGTVTANAGSGTQAVSLATLPALVAGTANIGDIDVLTVPADPFGVNADAASLSTSISAKLRAIATALGTTALDLGPATGGSRTLRVAVDTGQLGTLIRSAVPVVTGGYKYQIVAASATNVALQTTTGAIGDYLETLVCVVATPATSGVLIGDGVSPASIVLGDNVAGGVGTYHIALGILSTAGSWRVTTHAGVTVIATGNWT